MTESHSFWDTPFLNTAKALIDVFNGKITLQVGDGTVTFSVMEKTKVDCSDREKFVSSIDARILHTDPGADHRAGEVQKEEKDLDGENQAIETTVSPKQGPSRLASKPPDSPKVKVKTHKKMEVDTLGSISSWNNLYKDASVGTKEDPPDRYITH
jgi:hypothetical protein